MLDGHPKDETIIKSTRLVTAFPAHMVHAGWILAITRGAILGAVVGVAMAKAAFSGSTGGLR